MITDCETLRQVVKEIIEDYAKQNTRYLELRSTPKQAGQISSKEMYLQTVLNVIHEMKDICQNIKVTFLASVNRA